MYDEDVLGFCFYALEPFEQFVAIGVGAESEDAFDVRSYGVGLAVDTYFFCAFDDDASECSEGLVADEHDGAFGSGDVVYEVVFDPSAGAHSGACDYHDGSLDVVKRF